MIARAISIVTVVAVLASCSEGLDVTADGEVQRGIRALSAGRTGPAVEAFTRALEQEPRHHLALYNLGYIAQLRGNGEDAERRYRAVLDRSPSFEAALFNLALLRERAGATQEAIALYRRVIDVNATNAEAHLSLGLLLLRAGRQEPAERRIQAATRLDPNLIAQLADEPLTPTTVAGGSTQTTDAS